MIENIIKSIFGDPDKKKLKRYSQILEQIKQKELDFQNFTLEDIKNKTIELKLKFDGLNFQIKEDSIKIKELLSEILPEAFANIKQASKLIYNKEFEFENGKKITWDKIPYDVQVIGGIAIHEGQIAEMKTGEGKTLVATFPAYLNSLSGNPVHIVTVNDYLAQRDALEMGILYSTLGLTTGVIVHDQNHQQKYINYHCDVVYATNNEMGFDYLRDNMVKDEDEKVMSAPFFAIIDEVDSILIDEARTPLIISTSDNEPTSKYMQFSTLSKNLQEGVDYKIDEKQKTATLTEPGITKIEKLLGVDNIYVSERYNDLHHIENALKSRAVYKKDKDYLVSQTGEVLIIDEHTGRVLSGRRYSDGLHQAIEAKEGVEIKRESKTLASITFQNYFRMYWKLAGMTGTAKTEEEEFYKVYALETLVIPTNKPIARIDKSDLLFKNENGKFQYVVNLIKEIYKNGQPILVGTISVEKSEYLSLKLKEAGIPHNVLNAKHHEREAEIVSSAGQKGAVTIATNMAGRGTDIRLGEGVVEVGGLYIIGTEKHETRRIDNQLKGRAGRQGDPGITQFLISPNDEIMRIFGGDKLFGIFNNPMFASIPDDIPLADSKILTSRVTTVQKQVEGYNFDSRKHVLEYDDVINKHREIIYAKRNKILKTDNIFDELKNILNHQINSIINLSFLSENKFDLDKVVKSINDLIGIDILFEGELDGLNKEEMAEIILSKGLKELDKIKEIFKDENDFYKIEKSIALESIDTLWMRHIDNMSKLREAVAFEGYAQRNPLIVYKERAFEKFEELMYETEYKITKSVFSIKIDLEIKQTEFNDSDLIVSNSEETLNSLNIKAENNNTNPLFTNPGIKQQKNLDKTKIRV